MYVTGLKKPTAEWSFRDSILIINHLRVPALVYHQVWIQNVCLPPTGSLNPSRDTYLITRVSTNATWWKGTQFHLSLLMIRSLCYCLFSRIPSGSAMVSLSFVIYSIYMFFFLSFLHVLTVIFLWSSYIMSCLVPIFGDVICCLWPTLLSCGQSHGTWLLYQGFGYRLPLGLGLGLLLY